jgi:hypothetical protein
MTNLPESELIQLLPLEIYDEASCQDDTLIWLAPEEPTAFDQPAAPFQTLSLDVLEEAATALHSPSEEHRDLPATPARQSSSDQMASLPVESEQSESAAAVQVSASPLTYNAVAQFNITRWLLRVAALVSVLLIGSVLPTILQHMRPTPATASAAVAASSMQGSSRPTVRVLTVMAGRQDTVRDLSVRLVGRFDANLLEEIRGLNPDLKDPNHLEDGQLVRIPLRITAR